MKKHFFSILLLFVIAGCDKDEDGMAAPVNTALPLIIGDPVQKEILNSTTGTWTGTEITYAYQWLADDIAINGAVNSSFTLTVAEVGKTIKLKVTATNTAGSVEATSLPTVLITEDEASAFLNCRLSSIVSTGPYSRTETYAYDDDGKRIEWTLEQTEIDPFTTSKEFEYDGNKLVKINNADGSTRELIYESDKIIQVIDKDINGNLSTTDYHEWSGSVLTVTIKNTGSVVLYSEAYTFDGDDIIKEEYHEYSGGVLSFKRVLDYSAFDELYNPEYLIEYPLPASLHNYNHIVVTDTDYSGGSPVESSFTYEYEVTANESNAVGNRTRTRSDNDETLVRVYSYENCN